jgi:N4-gp56 family major capsid protein
MFNVSGNLAGKMASLIDSQILKSLKNSVYFMKPAKKMSATKSGTYSVNVFSRIKKTVAELTLTDGVEASEANVNTLSTIPFTPVEYGLVTRVTRLSLLQNSSGSQLLMDIADEARYTMARCMDDVVQNVLNAEAGTKIYAGGTSRATIPAGATGQLTATQFSQVAALFGKKAAGSKDKWVIIDENVAHDLRIEQGSTKFNIIESRIYATPDNVVANGEIGKIAGFRTIVAGSVNALTTTGGVGGNQTIYPTFFVVQDSYAVADWEKIETNVVTTSDHTNVNKRYMSVGSYVAFGAKVVRPEHVCIIESNASINYTE